MVQIGAPAQPQLKSVWQGGLGSGSSTRQASRWLRSRITSGLRVQLRLNPISCATHPKLYPSRLQLTDFVSKLHQLCFLFHKGCVQAPPAMLLCFLLRRIFIGCSATFLTCSEGRLHRLAIRQWSSQTTRAYHLREMSHADRTADGYVKAGCLLISNTLMSHLQTRGTILRKSHVWGQQDIQGSWNNWCWDLRKFFSRQTLSD